MYSFLTLSAITFAAPLISYGFSHAGNDIGQTGFGYGQIGLLPMNGIVSQTNGPMNGILTQTYGPMNGYSGPGNANIGQMVGIQDRGLAASANTFGAGFGQLASQINQLGSQINQQIAQATQMMPLNQNSRNIQVEIQPVTQQDGSVQSGVVDISGPNGQQEYQVNVGPLAQLNPQQVLQGNQLRNGGEYGSRTGGNQGEGAPALNTQ